MDSVISQIGSPCGRSTGWMAIRMAHRGRLKPVTGASSPCFTVATFARARSLHPQNSNTPTSFLAKLCVYISPSV